jgi:hypothetical protein
MSSVELLPPLIGGVLLQFRREVAVFVGVERACAAVARGLGATENDEVQDGYNVTIFWTSQRIPGKGGYDHHS